MPDQPLENVNSFYTTLFLPLTEEDKQVIKKSNKPYYQANFILLPVLFVAYFFGFWYFLITLVLVLLYNISAYSSIKKNELSLNNPKTILTGKVTQKEPPGDGTIIYLGPERFEVTYANPAFPIEVGDTVSLHYSQFDNNKRGILIRVEKDNH